MGAGQHAGRGVRRSAGHRRRRLRRRARGRGRSGPPGGGHAGHVPRRDDAADRTGAGPRPAHRRGPSFGRVRRRRAGALARGQGHRLISRTQAGASRARRRRPRRSRARSSSRPAGGRLVHGLAHAAVQVERRSGAWWRPASRATPWSRAGWRRCRCDRAARRRATTALTRPMVNASSARNVRLDSSRSLARPRPMSRGSSHDRPYSAGRLSLPCAVVSLAPAAAKRRSQ